MTYGNVYVAAVALGADDMHTVKVFHDDLVHGLDQSRAAVHAGAWPLFRYDPRRRQDAKNPLQLDSKAPALPFRQYAYNGTRDTMLAHANPEAAAKALALAEADAQHRWRLYERLAAAPTEAP